MIIISSVYFEVVATFLLIIVSLFFENVVIIPSSENDKSNFRNTNKKFELVPIWWIFNKFIFTN